MGLVTGIAKIAQKAYRYIRYGKQVGKPLKTGIKYIKEAEQQQVSMQKER